VKYDWLIVIPLRRHERQSERVTSTSSPPSISHGHPALLLKPQKNEVEDAKREIEAMGLGGYCSVLQFARELE
jgi:hypothetical protein